MINKQVHIIHILQYLHTFMYVHVYWYFYARLKEDTIIKNKITVVSIMFISINFHGFCKNDKSDSFKDT